MSGYPIANAWVSLPVVTVTTTPAQAITQAQIDALSQAGYPLRNLQWIEYYADATVLRGGPPPPTSGLSSAPATDYLPLTAGVALELEANRGRGQFFCTAAGTATLRVNLGFEA